MAVVHHALSIKQPWAALIVAGRKTIEVRTWPTRRVGPVFIHAGKLVDPRPAAWRCVDTPELVVAAAQVGGVIGVAELIECVTYPTPAAFAADRDRHRNEESWFRPPQLYGFRFRAARPLPFAACPGNTFFFPVDVEMNDAPPPDPRWVVQPPESDDRTRGRSR